MNKNIRNILKNYLLENNYDGFINLETGCFCEVENVMAKCTNTFEPPNCVVGRKQFRENCGLTNCIYWKLTKHCYCIQPVFDGVFIYK